MRIANEPRTHQMGAPQRVATRKTKTFPAPTRGWVRNENLAEDDPADAAADVLENFFPFAYGVRVRGGSTLYATVGSGQRVGAIIPYVAGAQTNLFAANANALYDITTVADPAVSPAAVLSSLGSADWQWVQFSTPGGVFLRMVNGIDTPLVYDGATWGTAPAITGPSSANNLSHVWQFKNRLFFCEKNTLNAWYLPTDNIGGAASKFPLGGVAKRGGSLLFGTSWSIWTLYGIAEKCIFVTTEGEVIVYEGTDPSNAASWALEGVYRIGRPLGPRALFKAGGDIGIATDIGIVPLSQVFTTDLGALGNKALTNAIETEWDKEVTNRTGVYPWHVEMWPTKQMLIVAMPTYSSLPLRCFVANIRTGAWCRYTGWDTHCLGLYVNRMFFGTSSGTVVEAETGGSDQGTPYTCRYASLYDDLGAPGQPKVVYQAQPVYLTTQTIGDKVSVAFDYTSIFPVAPNAAAIIGGANSWDTGVWGTAVWSDTLTSRTQKNWATVTGIGVGVAVCDQVTIAQTGLPDIQLIEMNLQYQIGNAPG